jgi:hypothetical protein
MFTSWVPVADQLQLVTAVKEVGQAVGAGGDCRAGYSVTVKSAA